MKFKYLAVLAILLTGVHHALPVSAKETEKFRPTYSLHGEVEFTADSYFGNYPTATEEYLANGGYTTEDAETDENEILSNQIATYYPLNNPTRPNTNQKITLEFYANPIPNFELLIKPIYDSEVYWDQLEARYYTDRALYTLGYLKTEFGALGLLLSDDARFEGIMVNTRCKSTWITLLYSQDNQTYYHDDAEHFPYLSDSDNMLGCRLSRKYGANLVGLNIFADGFEDEKAFSLDFNGKIGGHSATAEIGWVSPSGLNRNFDTTTPADEIDAGFYPGMLISLNIVETPKQMLRLTLGGLSKGFWPTYGTRNQRDMTDTVKLERNFWGIDLLHQLAFAKNWIFATNLVAMQAIDPDFYDLYQKPTFTYPTRTLGFKLTKHLSKSTEISSTLIYYGDHDHDYGKLAVKWLTRF
jgi:hypothetical protein